MTREVAEWKQRGEQQWQHAASTSSSTLDHFKDLKDITALIRKGAQTQNVLTIVRAIRLTFPLRKKLKVSALFTFLNFALLPGSALHFHLSSYFLPEEDNDKMEVDTATSVTQTPTEQPLQEIELYCYLLVLFYLLDRKRYNEAKTCSSDSIAHIKKQKGLISQTQDVLASKLYFYYSLSFELTGNLAEIRGTLHGLHQTATLRHNRLGQETLLNLLLRNYLHYNLYSQAKKLRLMAPRPESRSSPQYCRYLFYVGKIKTIHLEYTDAKESLLQAVQRAPVSALGFQIQCIKWAVIASLLLGEIPERSLFQQKQMQKALRPYHDVTNAVRIGDLELFKSVTEKFATTFISNGTNNLIIRLRQSVIRTGLCNISTLYSRISLTDIAKRLRLDSANLIPDAENLVAKATRHGIIDATIDHANGWVIQKEMQDIYSTFEPQAAFSSRVAVCFNLHNEVACALQFPSNSCKKKEFRESRATIRRARVSSYMKYSRRDQG